VLVGALRGGWSPRSWSGQGCYRGALIAWHWYTYKNVKIKQDRLGTDCAALTSLNQLTKLLTTVVNSSV